MNSLKIAIPLKTSSVRVKNKNLRPFVDGRSLFDIKAGQLLNHFAPEDIFVSSENPEAEPVVRAYGFQFLPRDPALARPDASWAEVIKDVVTRMPPGCDILWAQVTQPLFDEFGQVLKTWREVYDRHDSLAVVKKFAHHLIDDRARPVNFNFGYWHQQSQELPAFYQLTWACFVMKRAMVESCWYNIGRSPFLYCTDAPLVDIDTPRDFEVAGILYQHYAKQSVPDLLLLAAG